MKNIQIDLGRKLDRVDCSDLLWDYLCETHGEVKTVGVWRSNEKLNGEYVYNHPSFNEQDKEKALRWVTAKLLTIASEAMPD